MSKKAETKEVAKAEEETKEVILAGNTPDDIDFDVGAGAGSENMTADDIAIPRLAIIQSLSPQRSKTKSEYIDGAEEGMIFDKSTNELFDGEEGVYVVPISFLKSYLEWAPRASGQGLVKHHGSDPTAYNAITPNDKFQRITEDGNEIIPTAEYFVYIVDIKTGAFSPCVLSMSKSGLKQAKTWNAMITKLTAPHPKSPEKLWDAPIYWGLYKLSAAPESNAQGDWFRWNIAPQGTIDQLPSCWDIYKGAEKFRTAIDKGEVKAQQEDHGDAGATSESDEDPM